MRGRWTLLAVALTGLSLGSSLGVTSAAFSTVTENPANTFQAAPSFCGASQALTATADAWVSPNPPHASHGGEAALYVVSQAQNRRTLVAFDLPPVPAGCSLVDARLRLHATSSAGDRTILAYRAASAWAEGGVSWNDQPGTSGPPASAASGSGWREWSVLPQVLDMYASGNHGFLLMDSAEGAQGQGFTQAYDSREAGSDPPTLVLTFG